MFLILPPLSLKRRARSSKLTPGSSGTSEGQMLCQMRRRSVSSGRGKWTEKASRRANESSRLSRLLVARMTMPSNCSIFWSKYEISMWRTGRGVAHFGSLSE